MDLRQVSENSIWDPEETTEFCTSTDLLITLKSRQKYQQIYLEGVLLQKQGKNWKPVFRTWRSLMKAEICSSWERGTCWHLELQKIHCFLDRIAKIPSGNRAQNPVGIIIVKVIGWIDSKNSKFPHEKLMRFSYSISCISEKDFTSAGASCTREYSTSTGYPAGYRDKCVYSLSHWKYLSEW